jgi:Tol biopolymer transport system component
VTRTVVFVIVAVVVATFAGALAVSSRATAPGENGRIVFERLRVQNGPYWGELFVANPDGSGIRRITRPPNGTEDSNPDWSPDGTRIVFVRAPSVGVHSLWTVSGRGTGLRRLTPPCPPGRGIPRCDADDGWPVWSPDGRQIAFQRLSGGLRPKGATVNTATAIFRDELVVADSNGAHVRTPVWLGPWRGDPQSPAWSPDGKWLVFIGKFMASKTNGTGCECRSLWVVNADGSGLRRILAPGIRPGGRPDWSPDGTTILFRTHPGDDPSGYGSNLYTIRPDGSHVRRLTHFPSSVRVLDGSYAPDGNSIVFETSDGAVGGQAPDVFVMNVDGTNVRPLTRTRNFETGGDWGPVPAGG